MQRNSPSGTNRSAANAGAAGDSPPLQPLPESSRHAGPAAEGAPRGDGMLRLPPNSSEDSAASQIINEAGATQSQGTCAAGVVTAEVVEAVPAPSRDRTEAASIPFRLVRGFGRFVEWPFGLACLVVGLAVLAAIPILQLLSLGYLLEVSGRVARTGRIRSGFIGVRKAARAGSVLLGAWLCLLPAQVVSSIWYKSNLIAPESGITANWRTAQLVVTVLSVGHILAACYCGGRLRHFFWPLLAPFSLGMWLLRWTVSNRPFRPLVDGTLGRAAPRLVSDICGWRPLSDWFLPAVLVSGFLRGTLYANARDGLWDFFHGLRLPYYFSLGLRGLCGAVVWLLGPSLLLTGGVLLPAGRGGGICLLLGAPLMIAVVLYLPFLQVHFAAENRLRAYLELGHVRRLFRHAPIAFLIAFVVTIVFAVPPFLFKIAPLSNLGATENELTWIACLVFIAFIFPAKLLTGWAVGRGRGRERPAHRAVRWLVRPAMLTPPVAYVFVLFFTQYISWHGTWSLFEQHVFLVPAPFFGAF